MKTEGEIRRDVEQELQWSPDVDATDIAVKVNDNIVTLTGFAQSYFEKYRAEDAVKRVAGVAGVANDIEVRLPTGHEVADPEIARQAVAAIHNVLPAVSDQIKTVVQRGHVTLEGALEWQHQKETAGTVVRQLKGVTGLTNLITIQPRAEPLEIRRRIEEAFRRSAEVDASHITVEANGGVVTLRGRVSSLSERAEAQRTAWSAPGVTHVKNEIEVAI